MGKHAYCICLLSRIDIYTNERIYSVEFFEIDIQSTFKIISEKINPNAEISYDHHRIRPEKSEVERLFCDNSKALQFLDWKPLYNNKLNFSKGIKETINWYRNKKNISNFKDLGYVI